MLLVCATLSTAEAVKKKPKRRSRRKRRLGLLYRRRLDRLRLVQDEETGEDEDPLGNSDGGNPPWLSTDDVASFATSIENVLGHLGRLT